MLKKAQIERKKNISGQMCGEAEHLCRRSMQTTLNLNKLWGGGGCVAPKIKILYKLFLS